jgi:hypothetical protein
VSRLRGHGERDLDLIVERGLVPEAEQIAAEVRIDPLEAAQAGEHVAAEGAHDNPVHVEKPRPDRVEEEIDRLGLPTPCSAA